MMPTKEDILERLIELNMQIEAQRGSILSLASSVLGRYVSLPSLHGIIGGKNRDFADVEKKQFLSPAEFQAAWAEQMIAYYEPSKKYWKTADDLPPIIKLYKNPTIRQYILLFQERNYYRWYEQRIRQKPLEPLWVIWFGSNIVFGLYVTLSFLPDGAFKFKPSEVRKVPYNYWTIGNVLGVKGFVNAQTGHLYPIKSIDDLFVFYENIIFCLSKSGYEKAIYTRYIEYLKASPNVLDEPFLIPELHYEGKDKGCLYRLDFAICNPYTFECVGFEISPASSHMHISKTKDKLQQQINAEVAANWERECDKRNSYFSKYGITTITFTDSHLKDIDACFEQIKIYLLKRRQVPQPLEDSLNMLNEIANY